MEIRIGENIKKLRKEHAMTQEQLAEALGVTVGAVHKWESRQSMPEIRLLVELAELFEISVDAILGYGWEKGSMAQAAERIRACIRDKQLEEGICLAQRALKKYPNSFEVTYCSAELYALVMSVQDEGYAQKAIELYWESVRLIDQNPYPHINRVSIENRIATCYCYQKKWEEGIALFQKNNIDGQNEYCIGQALSKQPGKANEAVYHLSNALGGCYSQLCNICMGYADAYFALGESDKLKRLMLWFYELSQGLRDTSQVHYMDRMDVRVFSALAAVAAGQGDRAEAKNWLRKAKALAERFDREPNYDVRNIYFYYGSENARAYDDMGETAGDVIFNSWKQDESETLLRPLWEELCHEEE